MQKLAESSGIIVSEKGDKLYFSKKPGQWTTIFLFVTALFTLLFFANGILQLFVFRNFGMQVALIFIVIGLSFGLITWRVIVYRKKVNAKPVEDLKPFCIIDFGSNTLFDEDNRALASLTEVRMERKMQMTSSSSALVLKWNKKSFVLVEGSPFSGGVSEIESLLASRGINSK